MSGHGSGSIYGIEHRCRGTAVAIDELDLTEGVKSRAEDDVVASGAGVDDFAAVLDDGTLVSSVVRASVMLDAVE